MGLELVEEVGRLIVVDADAGVGEGQEELLVLEDEVEPLFALGYELIEILVEDVHGLHVGHLKPLMDCLGGKVDLEDFLVFLA